MAGFPGLAIENLTVADKSDVQGLQDENTQLREEIDYLQQLLSVWQPPACTCQLVSSSTNSSSKTGRVGGSTAVQDASSTQAVVDKIIRRQQVLIAQQQRQLQVLQVELSSREQLIQEADAVLAETHRRITALASWASQAAGATHVPAQQQQQPAMQQPRTASTPAGAASTSRRVLNPSSSSQMGRPETSASSSSSMRAAGAGAAGARVGSAAGSVQQVCCVVLEQCRSLLTWCRESDARIARSKAASAAQCRALAAAGATAATTTSAGTHRRRAAASSSGGGSSSSKQQWQGPGQAAQQAAPADVQQALQLPYLPTGGNSFLQPGAGMTLTGIASGQGLSTIALAALPHLLQQLAGLAAPLAAFAVQLRSSILPAMPWLQAGQLAPELTRSCAQLAQQAASAAVKLSELCALLPAAPAVLSAPAAAAACQARAGLAAAAAEAGNWGSTRQQHQGKQQVQQAGLLSAADADATATEEDLSDAASALEAEDVSLLHQLTLLLQPQHSQHGQHKGSPAGGKDTPAQAHAAVQRLQQRLSVVGLKQRVLNEQLAFLAQCSAASAKLMTSLASDVLQALVSAIEAGEPSALQQQRSRALQLCSQLQRAALLAQQQGTATSGTDDSLSGSMQLPRSSSGRSSSGSGSSTARTVLALLDSNRDVLDAMPKLLATSSASALKAAATAAVVAALSNFRAGLQP